MPIDPNSSWLLPAVQRMSTRGLSVEGAREWVQGVVPQDANDRLRISNNVADSLREAAGGLAGAAGGFSPARILSGVVEGSPLDFGRGQADELAVRAFDFAGNPVSSLRQQAEELAGSGRELIGHELAHVVQQGSGLAERGREALGGLRSILPF